MLLPIVAVLLSLFLTVVSLLMWMSLRSRQLFGKRPRVVAPLSQPTPLPDLAVQMQTIPPVGVAYLMLDTVGQPPVYYPLAHSSTVIGRDPTCEIEIDQRYTGISRRHAQIFFDGKSHILADLDSDNGVFVNGIRIGRNRLYEGALISLGQIMTYTYCRNSTGTLP